MAKLILLGIVLFTTALPMALSGRRAPKRSIRTIHLLTVLAVFVWAYACRSCYPRLVFPE